jgi:ATP-binding cassette subfamily C protein
MTLPRSGIRGLLAATFFFSVFTNLLMLTGPIYMLQVYDRVLGSRSEETLVALTGLMAALYVFYGLIEYARGRVMARAGARLDSALAGPLFRAVVERAALWRREGKGTIDDLDAVRGFFAAPVLLALCDMPWTPLFLAAIFVFHPLLGWCAVAGGAILIVATFLNQLLTRRMTAVSAGHSVAARQIARQAEEGGELVQAQGMEPTLARRWLETRDAAITSGLRASDRMGWFGAFTKSFRLFLQSATLAVGAWLVLRGEMTAGGMIAASILLGRALAPIEIGISQWSAVQRARNGFRDIAALLAGTPGGELRTELPAPTARVEVRDLSVVLPTGDRPVLRHVSVDLRPGEAVGVIGRSGSGKTTLARSIVGLVSPAEGEVRLGGAKLGQYSSERLGTHIGYLPQETWLFDGTVAENIARMERNPDPAQVVAAARKALVHDVILSLPEGYDTRLCASGTPLSGGQKQRVALARALYGNPVLLVLDEPNSALDSEGSEALNAAVAAMKADGRCVVIMTHRPMALSACDRLLVLEGGRMAGYGPRDEVVRAMMQNAAGVQRLGDRKAAS